jgi:hypothetical protein
MLNGVRTKLYQASNATKMVLSKSYQNGVVGTDDVYKKHHHPSDLFDISIQYLELIAARSSRLREGNRRSVP